MKIQNLLFPEEKQAEPLSISIEQKDLLIEIIAEIIKQSYQQKQKRNPKDEHRKN